MQYATDTLSRAASAVLAVRNPEHLAAELAMDGSGELGGRIHAHYERAAAEAVLEAGYTSAEAYNAALRDRLTDEQGRMSYRAYCLLGDLELDTELLAA